MTRPYGCVPGARARSFRHHDAGRTPTFAACVLGLIVAALFGACQSADPSGEHGVSAVQFQDVVVPSGMQLRDEAHESHSRDDAGHRQAHYVYTGPTRVEDAIAYVRQRMPQHDWTMVSEDKSEDDGVRLRFERGIYRADYSFTRSEGATVMVVDYSTDYSRR
jgi:hypothetical protein